MKKGVILPVVILILLFVSISTTTIVSFVNSNTKNTTSFQKKYDNQIDAGNVFFSLVGYFQKKYNDTSTLNMGNINTFNSTDTIPLWYDELITGLSSSTTIENSSWTQSFNQFNTTYYLPTENMKLALEEITPDSDIDIVVRTHIIYQNLLLATIRTTDSNSFESVFWGMISPRYFSNWAVMLLNGIDSYYWYDEMVDGPSYYGGKGVGFSVKIPPDTEVQKEAPYVYDFGSTFIGNMMNKKPRINSFKWNGSSSYYDIWLDEDGDETGDEKLFDNVKVGWTEYNDGYYIYINSSLSSIKVLEVKEFLEDGNDLIVSGLLTSESGVQLYPNDYQTRVSRLSKYLPWYYKNGISYITDDVHTGMVDRFADMQSYYQGYIDNNKVSKSQNVIKSYLQGNSISGSNLGVFMGGASLSDITYDDKTFNDIYYIQDISTESATEVNVIERMDYSSVDILTDVLTGQHVFSRYGLEGFIEDEEYSVQEYWYRERYDTWEQTLSGWDRIDYDEWRDIAQVVITASSEFENLPEWDCKTFFVIKKGEGSGSVELLDEDIGAIDMRHAGVFIMDNDFVIGEGGLPQGTGHGSKLALIDGRFSFISRTGDVKIVGDIVYNDVYDDLKSYMNKPLVGEDIDFNDLITENNANDMLNLVSIEKNIYMPHDENKNNKNIKLMSNIFAFGNTSGGSFYIEQYQNYGEMGYRHVFGTIIAKTQSATFRTNGNKYNGFKEYNVYDNRLYTNEDLPVATPESSLLMAFGFGMR